MATRYCAVGLFDRRMEIRQLVGRRESGAESASTSTAASTHASHRRSRGAGSSTWLLPRRRTRLSSRAKPCRKIENDVETPAVRRGRQLRPGASADGRRGPDRRRRSGVHEPAAGGDLLPRLPRHGLRHLRIVDVELHGEDRRAQLPLCRRAGLRLARVPAQFDLCAHATASRRRPTSRASASACRNISSPPASGRASSWRTITA